ncbi:single-stranded DNA-binding protein [Mucilaginibacter sp. PAMB04168]|uniref:single-stranded DNA-binding protein n=1 Tax=Mucilaginibacter sp. PAMB04168 TaxID=3138567 RepID=UPI0031F67083
MFNNAGINKVFLVGHVGKTPRLHTQADGLNFFSFPLATNEFIKKNNQSVEHVEWHQVKIPVPMLSETAPDLNKGHLIYLEGKIKTKCYTDELGIKRYKSEVLCVNFRVLSSIPAEVQVASEGELM